MMIYFEKKKEVAIELFNPFMLSLKEPFWVVLG